MSSIADNTSRYAVLGSIRRALRRTTALDPSVRTGLEARTGEHRPHLRPQVSGDLAARFVDKAAAVHVTVECVDRYAGLPDAVVRYLNHHGLGHSVLMSHDEQLNALSWPASLAIERRRAGRDDVVSVTVALAAVAETGTVVLASSPSHPTSQNFLPDHHLAILPSDRIVPHLEDVWQLLRNRGAMPRTVNFVTGPSKTGDVEQTIEYGAHGPRQVHVFLIGAGG